MRSKSIVPIAGMVGFRDGPGQVLIGDVCFVTCYQLSEGWSNFGFPGDPVDYLRGSPYQMDLEDVDVVGVFESSLSAKEALDVAIGAVRHSLKLLLSCNSAWGRGSKRWRPVLPGVNVGRLLGFVSSIELSEGGKSWVRGTSEGPLHEVQLDGFWAENSKAGFYYELADLLSDHLLVEGDWRDRLLDAASLLGHSRMAATPWEAFLIAMVGMERLLKSERNGWSEQVGGNIRSLFSWLRGGKGEWYVDELYKLYSLRNAMVHEGRVADITPRNAHIADEVLFNLLLVSFKHLDSVKSLADLIERGRVMEDQVAKGEKPTALPNATVIHAFDY